MQQTCLQAVQGRPLLIEVHVQSPAGDVTNPFLGSVLLSHVHHTMQNITHVDVSESHRFEAGQRERFKHCGLAGHQQLARSVLPFLACHALHGVDALRSLLVLGCRFHGTQHHLLHFLTQGGQSGLNVVHVHGDLSLIEKGVGPPPPRDRVIPSGVDELSNQVLDAASSFQSRIISSQRRLPWSK